MTTIEQVPAEIRVTARQRVNVNAYAANLGHVNSFEEFGSIYSEEDRQALHAAVLDIIDQAGVQPEEVLVAGYDEDYATRVLEHKSPSSQDAHTAARIRSKESGLRDDLKEIAGKMVELDKEGILTDATREELLQKVNETKAQIAIVQDEARVEPQLPIYFFTGPEGILDLEAENNPLAYAGVNPGMSKLALYNRRALRDAGYRIDDRDNIFDASNEPDYAEQYMIAIDPAELEKFRIASIYLNFVLNDAQAPS